MKVKSLLAAILGLALALSALTGVAGAGKPDDPGKSEDAPGQVKKAEEAPPATPASQGKSASAPGQVKKAEKAPSPAKGKSESAPGQVKKAEKAPSPAKGKSEAKGQGEGNLKTAHKKVLICHSTGSATNPWVVISVSVNALKSGHDQLGTREAVLSEMATQPGRRTADVHGSRFDIILGPSSPGRIENKAELEARCLQLAGIQPPPPQQVLEQPPAAQEEQGGVLGAQAVVRQPPAQRGQGGVLGEIGAVAAAELPFTGIQLWIALLAGIGLLAAGLGARKAMR